MKLHEAEQAREVQQACRAGQLIAELDEKDRETFDRWLVNAKPAFWISNIMRDAGIAMAADTLRVHLNGRCKCNGNHGAGAYRDA